MISAVLSAASAIVPGIFRIVDKAVENKDEANKIKQEIQLSLLSGQLEEMKTAASIIVAEVKGESWMQRNWRPTLMMTIVAIIANNYLIAPYLSLFFDVGIVLELPEELYTLMTIGVGGYITSRGAEKGLKTWVEGKK